MNDTVAVQKQSLSDIYETIEDIKAKVALLSHIDIDEISKSVSYGLYLFGQNIIDDLQQIQDTVKSLKDSDNE